MGKEAKIKIQKNEEGHWLCFKDSTNKQAMINVENTFADNNIIDSCIKQWAIDQFE
jgi:hypothetical protein